MIRTLLAAMLITTAMLSACGELKLTRSGPTATPTPATTPVTDEEFRNAAAIAADNAVLVLKDLPGTWRVEANANVIGPALLERMSVECRRVFTPGPNELARKDSAAFTGEGLFALRSNATVYRTARIARTEETAAISLLSDCGDALANVLGEDLRARLAARGLPYGEADVTFEKAHAPRAGESSSEFHFRYSSGSGAPPGHFGIIEVRQGRIIGTVTYTATSSDDVGPIRDDLVAILARRLKKADAGLPR
jgi:hypothetical protein